MREGAPVSLLSIVWEHDAALRREARAEPGVAMIREMDTVKLARAAREAFDRFTPGGCRWLSEGDACTCLKCVADALESVAADRDALRTQLKEIADSFDHLLRCRHAAAHNGDVIKAGHYETCRLCEPARVLIEQAQAYSGRGKA